MLAVNLDIHGLAVRIESEDVSLADELRRRLAYFEVATPEAPDVRCRFEVVEEPGSVSMTPPAGPSRSVYDPLRGSMLYFPELDQLIVALPELSMRVDPGRGEVDVRLRPDPAPRWLATRSVFMFGLVETLKRRGIYGLHAAAVARGGRSLVMAGVNGAGKSTLALSLLRDGGEFQGDDQVFLALDDGIGVLAFPDHIGVTPETAGLLPDLARDPRYAAPVPEGERKHELPVSTLPTVDVPARTRPAAFVLVEPTSQAYALEPIDPSEALIALAPNVLATETVSSQAHLDSLAALVGSCPSYRLTGRGPLEAAGGLLRPLLAV